jgi:hypothetical protein
MWIFSLLFSKLGGFLAGAIGVLGLFLGYKYQKNRAESAEARADGYQAQAEIAHGREEVQDEVDKVVKGTAQKVQAGDTAGLSDDFNTLK